MAPRDELSPGAYALSQHQRTHGMAVSMGWTCQCNKWCESNREQLEHQADEVIKAYEANKNE